MPGRGEPGHYFWFRSAPGEVTPTILFCGQIVYSTVVLKFKKKKTLLWSSCAEPEILVSFFLHQVLIMLVFFL